jgi:hypothetical protein
MAYGLKYYTEKPEHNMFQSYKEGFYELYMAYKISISRVSADLGWTLEYKYNGFSSISPDSYSCRIWYIT